MMRHGLVAAALAMGLVAHATRAKAQLFEVVKEGEEEKAEAEKGAEKPGAEAPTDKSDLAYKEKSEQGRFGPAQKKKEEGAEAGAPSGPEKSIRLKERKRLNAFAEFYVGFGKAPIPGDGSRDIKGTSITLIAGGTFDVSPKFALGLAIPVSTGSVETPDKQPPDPKTSKTALGNPQLLGEYRGVQLGRSTFLPLGFSIGIPVAMGNPDPTTISWNDRATGALNDFVDAARGWRDGELFATKRFPIALSVGLNYYLAALEVHAFEKLLFLPKVGGKIEVPTGAIANDPNATYKMNGFAMRSVTGLGASYQLVDSIGLALGLDTWLAIRILNPIAYENSQATSSWSPFQFVLEPRLAATFGPVTPSIGFVAPVAGKLTDKGIYGLRLRADFAF
jgi:hypothetical protein